MRITSTLTAAASLGLLLAGCPGKEDTAEEETQQPDPTETGDSGFAAGADWVFSDVPGIPNFDDDDEDRQDDWSQRGVSGENDLAEFVIADAYFAELADDQSLTLSLSGETDAIRVWHDGSIVLGESESGELADYTLPAGAGDMAFQVEFSYFLVQGVLTLQQHDAGGAVINEASFRVGASPLIMNHHLQDTELVWAIDAGSENSAFIDSLRDLLGDKLVTGSANQYGWDVWIQDEFELSTTTSTDLRGNVIIDSIRTTGGYGLDAFPEQMIEAPDYTVMTWGSGWASSLDSFGNLDATPPVTVDGVEYPFGRIYYGCGAHDCIVSQLTDFLETQLVQDPFSVDSTWLCVGHVDEFVSFIADSSSDLGFKMMFADTSLMYDFLGGLDPDMSIPKYRRAHDYSTIGEILDDDALRLYNEELQEDHLDPLRATMMEQLGLTEDDVILYPGIYENYWGNCGALAMIPGMINYLVVNLEGVPHAVLPDPFLREDVDDQSSDPLIAYSDTLFPAGVETHYIDDWDTYHMMMGEVHCGTNSLRTPSDAQWWTDAAHLIGWE